jgi:hydroxyethylthiazole kinase-like uncharacterized protein yjeF
MKILSAEQIRALDKYTIEHEPIKSIDLMERAADKVFSCLMELDRHREQVVIFCGMGNNGGDGLAVAKLLKRWKKVSVNVIKHTSEPSPDFLQSVERLKTQPVIKYIENESQIPSIRKDTLVIDALFGTGLTRRAEGIAAEVIKAINQSGAEVYSIDTPSGLFCDKSNSEGDAIIHSTRTFTFHAPKLSFLFPENAKYIPDYEVLDIGLLREYEGQLDSAYFFLDDKLVKPLLKKREKFSHKGTYGHALIAAGSYGKAGAAVLAVKAALRSGAGLVTANIPLSAYELMQISNPEAMVEAKGAGDYLNVVPALEKYSAIGIGPGIGSEKETIKYLKELLSACKKPIVIDADALNILAANKKMLSSIPVNSILTPHPGEFKRLVGEWKTDSEKLEKQRAFSAKYKVVIVLKGANTAISLPNGKVYFNSTGNPGMAKGGSGDVLTGILTSLLAQGYSSEHAAVAGVFVHGLAGDLAKAKLGETGMKASDLVYYLPKAFMQLEYSISD